LIPGWLTFVGQISTRTKELFEPRIWAIAIAVSLLLITLLGFRIGRFAERNAERIPFLGKAWSDSRMAYWTDLMAVLIEHGTPEADAVELAARVGGQRQMIEKMQALTALLRAGHQPSIQDWKASGVPVLGAWAVTWRGPSTDRVASLRLIAQNYNRLARDRMILSTSLLPVLCLVLIGGLFTLMYGLMMFLPLTSLYRSLS
jgi:type II secretory pathway component PulF